MSATTSVRWIDIDMVRGDTPTFLLDFTADLTDAKIWFTAKRAFTDGDNAAVIALSTPSNGITIVSVGPPGQAKLKIPVGATTNLVTPTPPAPLTLMYDIQLLESDGTVTTVQQGYLNIRGDITRSVT